MSPQNLTDFVAVYESIRPTDNCKKIVDSLNNITWKSHSYNDHSSNEDVSFDDDLSVSFDSIPESDYLKDVIWDTINDYFTNKIDFAKTWYGGWHGFYPVRYNKYTPNTLMRLHCDHIHSMFEGEKKGIPVLSVLGTLNNDYEGGEFVLFEDCTVNLPSGSIIIFPSNFLYPHEVKRLKKGNRFSFVTWVW